jgi:hypothetical protein
MRPLGKINVPKIVTGVVGVVRLCFSQILRNRKEFKPVASPKHVNGSLRSIVEHFAN